MAMPVSRSSLDSLFREVEKCENGDIPSAQKLEELERKLRAIKLSSTASAEDRSLRGSIEGKITWLKEMARFTLRDEIHDGKTSQTSRHVVALRNARQYDMPGDRPNACTFHAVTAMAEIKTRFDEVFQLIQHGNSDKLSEIQRNIINQGLKNYEAALKKKPKVREGTDFAEIIHYLPEGIVLEAKGEEVVMFQSFEDRLKLVLNHLSGRELKTVGIKGLNAESFAVISKEGRAIIFDSHTNEIIGTIGEEETGNVLRKKLSDLKNEVDGTDYSPFEYAVSPYSDRSPTCQALCLRRITLTCYSLLRWISPLPKR